MRHRFDRHHVVLEARLCLDIISPACLHLSYFTANLCCTRFSAYGKWPSVLLRQAVLLAIKVASASQIIYFSDRAPIHVHHLLEAVQISQSYREAAFASLLCFL